MTKNNPSAFPDPQRAHPDSEQGSYDLGMTLRDYFAAAIIQGFCANGTVGTLSTHFDTAAKESYLIADALLKARQQ